MNVKAAGVLTGASVAAAVIAASGSLYVAKALGAQQYGVIGIVIAVLAVCTNVLDIRLGDLVMKLFYATAGRGAAVLRQRAAIIRLAVLLAVSIGCVMGVLGLVVMALSLHSFTDGGVAFNVVLWLTVAEVIGAPTNLIAFVLRFSQNWLAMGVLQLASSIVRTIALVSAVWYVPTMASFAAASVVSAILLLILALGMGVWLWRCAAPVSLLWRPRSSAWLLYRRELPSIIGFNAMGYTKLLHRSADVLLVGWFCSDRDTGVYKLARSLADAMLAVQDALTKVYQPALFQWLKNNDAEGFRKAARELLGAGAVLSICGAAGAWLVGEQLLVWLIGPQYSGVAQVAGVLMLAMPFTVGIHIWMWPLVVTQQRVGSFVSKQLVAVLTGQYMLALLLYFATGQNGVVWFAVGHVSAYALLYVPLYMTERQRTPLLVSGDGI